jgi:quercetin dioxygenase-like cupin family protein
VSPLSYEQFTRQARSENYDEVLERTWAPNTVLDTHTHDFDVDALVVQGEMWLTIGTEVRHLLPGDRFSLPRQLAHAERYGSEGATYWVARRHLR